MAKVGYTTSFIDWLWKVGKEAGRKDLEGLFKVTFEVITNYTDKADFTYKTMSIVGDAELLIDMVINPEMIDHPYSLISTIKEATYTRTNQFKVVSIEAVVD